MLFDKNNSILCGFPGQDRPKPRTPLGSGMSAPWLTETIPPFQGSQTLRLQALRETDPGTPQKRQVPRHVLCTTHPAPATEEPRRQDSHLLAPLWAAVQILCGFAVFLALLFSQKPKEVCRPSCASPSPRTADRLGWGQAELS